MSPTNHTCAAQLRHMIYYNLDLDLLDNALFMAGRLLAYEPRATEAAYLVALCNLRLHKYKLAYEHSKNIATRGTHLGCAYVYAQACLVQGKYQEGALALEKVKTQWKGKNSWGKHTDTRRQPLPDAPAVLCLLGKLWRALGDGNKASEYFSESLKLNPFMWEAHTSLCELGANVRTSKIFTMSSDLMKFMSDEESQSGETAIHTAVSQVANDPFTVATSRANGEVRNTFNKPTLMEKHNAASNPVVTIIGDGFETPPNANNAPAPVREIVVNGSDADAMEPPQAPFRRNRTVLGNGQLGVDSVPQAPPRMKASVPRLRKLANESEDGEGSGLGIITDRKRTVSGHTAQSGSSSSTTNSSSHPGDPMAPMARRSVRILNSGTTTSTSRPPSRLTATASTSTVSRDVRELKKAKAASLKGRANLTTVGRVVSGNRKHEPMDMDSKEQKFPGTSASIPQSIKQLTTASDRGKDIESVQMLLEVFGKLAGGYLALCQYRCQEAIQMFNTLPPAQHNTPWVLSQLGRAYFEQASWVDAEKFFVRVRNLAPARVEDLQYYSTVLWHLKRDVELSFLAHEIMDLDRLSPQAWCIIGNSMSLQRDHDSALKCFKRATQLNPKFAYAFTLQGHEHIASEEYDKALDAYRKAVAAENRHYNAWYGIANVYEKQGKYEMAEQHYRVASSINPTNAVLVCCIGVVLEKMKKIKVALTYYNKASSLAPKSTLARYKKARALMGMGEPQKALAELLILKDLVPEEANVHFLLGKVYKSLHEKSKAVKHFTSALNLDPKASQHIKEAMEQLEDELEEEEEEPMS